MGKQKYSSCPISGIPECPIIGEIDEEIENTFELSIGKFSLKAIKLSRIIKSKEAVGREKDRLVLPVLRDALATIEKISKRRKKSHPLKS